MRRALPAPWPRRVAALALLWVVTTGLLAWVGSHPSWIGLLSLLAALAGFVWFLLDVGGDHAATGWTTDPDVSSERPTLDGRLGTLRRLADTAGQAPTDGGRTRPAAIEVQGILRRAADLRTRATGAALPSDLADYLAADPAPLVSPAQLDHMLTRIEAL